MEYLDALKHIYENGIEETNQRTGVKTKRCFGITIDYQDGLPFTSRQVNPGISAAELAWMLSGKKETEWMKKYCKIWDKFEDSPGIIESAYGFRWRDAFGRDQINSLVELLTRDKSSRQGLVMSWDPRTDGLNDQGKFKNVPCPFAFNVYICNDKLRVIVYQRSADFIAGVPYDMMTYWMLGAAVTEELQVSFWGIQILFGDAHIYETHYNIACKTITSIYQPTYMKLKTRKIASILSYPDNFVNENWQLWNGLFEINEKVEVAQ